MKKLLSLFGSMTMLIIPSITIVSCTDKNINMVEIRDMRNNYVDTVDKTLVKDFSITGGINGGTLVYLEIYFIDGSKKDYDNLKGTKDWFNKYLNKLFFNIDY